MEEEGMGKEGSAASRVPALSLAGGRKTPVGGSGTRRLGWLPSARGEGSP